MLHPGAYLNQDLQRVRLLIAQQGEVLYRHCDIQVPTSCTSALMHLHEHGPSTIVEIAAGTSASHQLASQRLMQLEALSLVVSRQQTVDRRKSLVELSDQGRVQVRRLTTILGAVEQAMAALFAEIGVDLKVALEAAEAALRTTSLLERAMGCAAWPEEGEVAK